MKSAWRVIAACGLLIAVTVFAYARTFQNGFVNFDDNIYANENPFVAAGLTASSIHYAWTTFDLGNWIPLTWLSLQLDATLFGVNATAFHATNLLLHVANVLLLFGVLLRLTGATGKSAAVAALFAVHPLHVESVAWVSERKDVLSTFWLLLTLIAYERYAANPQRKQFILVMCCFTLGLLAKPMLITVPILLLLVDFWPLQRLADTGVAESVAGRYEQRSGTALFVEKIPLFVLSFAFGIIAIVAQGSGRSAFIGMDQLPIHFRAANAIHAYGWYLVKTACPIGLTVIYPHPMQTLSWILVTVSAIVLLVVTVMVIALGRRRRHLAFGWLWFLVSLLPVIGLLQVGSQAYADRYSYIPHIGLMTLVVWECSYWLGRVSYGRFVSFGLVGVAVLTCSILTRAQVGHWRSSESLWMHALDVDGANYFAHYEMGTIQLSSQRLDEAQDHFQQVLNQRPYNAEALTNLGYIHQIRREWEQAEDYYLLALRANPKHRKALDNLAGLQMQQGQSATVESDMAREVKGPAGAAEMRYEAGLTHLKQGKMEKALQEFEAALQINPNYASAHNNAALALTELNRLAEAKRHLSQAIQVDPRNLNAHVNLAILLESEGQLQEAKEHYETALHINPRDLESRQRLRRLSK